MLSQILWIAVILLTLALIGCAVRLLAGPTVPDRIMALDTIGIQLLAMTALLCMLQATTAYLDLILLIAAITFIGTTAFARFLERGAVFDDGQDDSRN